MFLACGYFCFCCFLTSPSCSIGTISLHHSLTPSLLHSLTPSLPHSFTPSLLRSFAPSLLRSFAPSLLRSFAPSLLRSFSPSLLHSFTPSIGIWEDINRIRTCSTLKCFVLVKQSLLIEQKYLFTTAQGWCVQIHCNVKRVGRPE